jgi:hypothetical protein
VQWSHGRNGTWQSAQREGGWIGRAVGRHEFRLGLERMPVVGCWALAGCIRERRKCAESLLSRAKAKGACRFSRVREV